jgi:hypothetical protein
MRKRPPYGPFAAAAVSFLLLVPTGCGSSDSLPREAVSGSVSLDRKPLETGMITFLPADASVPTQGGSPIVGGRYEIPRDQGLVPGKYKVVISSGADEPEKSVDKTNNDMPGMPPIPKKDNGFTGG